MFERLERLYVEHAAQIPHDDVRASAGIIPMGAGLIFEGFREGV